MDTEVNILTERINKLEKENSILRQQQIEITEAKELYLKIFEEFPALIWRSRLDKLCDYFNKTWLDFTGRTMEQEFGNGWTEGVHPDDFDFCLKTYSTAFDNRKAFLMEYRMKNKFDEYRWIRDFGRPFYDLDNTFLGYIGSCYDITENKNNELSLIELNATKDKFFSIIAHDLKGPFGYIVGLSKYLVEKLEEKDYKMIREVANEVLHSSTKSMNLLTNLMTWAQMQSGRMEYNPGYVEIEPLVKDAIQLLNGTAKDKSIIIEDTRMTKSQVVADKEMISSVLRNLIANAIKFTNTGGKITISAVDEQNQLIVSVSDTGVGISKERIDKLFSISDGYSTPGTEKESGTGLGLLLCKEFINKNNGEIWAESKVGFGTTLYFSLPLSIENGT